MGKFRISLGRTRDATNLVIDGDFPSAGSFATNWGTSDPGWIWNAGGYADQTGGGGDYLRQQNVFTLGKVYEVDFTGTGGVGLFIGDYGQKTAPYTGAGVHTERFRCLKGTDIQFYSNGGDVDNVEAYEMIYNSPLNDEPKGLQGGSITMERDQVLNALFRQYSNELIFHGDGWDYLFGAYQSDGFCDEIEALIETQCSDGETWETYFEGIIYLSEVEFNLERCEAKAIVEDAGIGQVLKNNRNVEIYVKQGFGFAVRNYLPDPGARIRYHDATGAYPVVPPYNGVVPTAFASLNVGLLFRNIIHSITGVDVDFVSTIFDSGTFQYLVMQYGAFLRADIPAKESASDWDEKLAVSFLDLFTEINKVFNVEVFINYPNGVPTINLEYKTTLLGAGNILTLNNVASPRFRFYNENFYKTISIGYNKTFDTDDGGVQFISEDACTQNELDIVSKFVADSNIIFESLAGELSAKNEFLNPYFGNTSNWVLGIGWVIGGGVATKAPGAVAPIGQHIETQANCEDNSTATYIPGCRYLLEFSIANATAGTLTPFMGANVGTPIAGNGTFSEIIRADPNDDRVGFTADALFDGDIDNLSCKRYFPKREYDDDVFLIETDGANSKQFGGGNEYNGNIQADDNMTRWVDTIQNSVINSREIETTITKSNTALTRVFEFNAPLSKSDWDLIVASPTDKITFNSRDLANTEGFIQKAVRKNDGGRTEFELITE